MSAARRAVVTGAGGFVGANLVRRLLAAATEVVAVERPGGSSSWRLDGLDVDRRSIDLRDREGVMRVFAEIAPGETFHLAAHGAYSWQTDRRGILDSNFEGTVNVVDACVAAGCEVLVNTGSSSEYGYRDRAPREDEAPRPNSDYAVSKAASTLYVGHVGREGGRRYSTLRLYSVYGPWEDERRLVPTLIEHGLRGVLPTLVSPVVARDLVYVDDVVEAYLLAARSDGVEPGGIYNIGSGRQTTIGELVELARSMLAIGEAPAWGSMPDRSWDTSVWVADPRKAGAQLGWSATRDLAAGFAATVAWARARASSGGT